MCDQRFGKQACLSDARCQFNDELCSTAPCLKINKLNCDERCDCVYDDKINTCISRSNERCNYYQQIQDYKTGETACVTRPQTCKEIDIVGKNFSQDAHSERVKLCNQQPMCQFDEARQVCEPNPQCTMCPGCFADKCVGPRAVVKDMYSANYHHYDQYGANVSLESVCGNLCQLNAVDSPADLQQADAECAAFKSVKSGWWWGGPKTQTGDAAGLLACQQRVLQPMRSQWCDRAGFVSGSTDHERCVQQSNRNCIDYKDNQPCTYNTDCSRLNQTGCDKAKEHGCLGYTKTGKFMCTNKPTCEELGYDNCDKAADRCQTSREFITDKQTFRNICVPRPKTCSFIVNNPAECEKQPGCEWYAGLCGTDETCKFCNCNK